MKRWPLRISVFFFIVFAPINAQATGKIAKPDPATSYLTYTLPDNASPVRLSLPARIEEIFAGPNNGLVGFGLHAGGHIEGLDHVWIELKAGTPVKSWANGTVTSVRWNGSRTAGEYHIMIDYGKRLTGIHMEIKKPYVKKGQRVNAGQKIGLGLSYNPDQSSAEFQLIDCYRSDGISSGSGCSYVSPYDYLRLSEKNKLVRAYKKYVLDPYKTGQAGSSLLQAYEPYLTNGINLAKRTKNRIEGVWYSLKTWKPGYPNDLLTFIRAKNPYISTSRVLGADDTSEGNVSEWTIDGTYTVDYGSKHLTMIDSRGTTYYGLFKIEPWKGRELLTIEYKTDAYPSTFSSKALRYASRINIPRRDDAVLLKVRKTP